MRKFLIGCSLVALVLIGYASGRNVTNRELREALETRDAALVAVEAYYAVAQDAIALAKHFKARCRQASL